MRSEHRENWGPGARHPCTLMDDAGQVSSAKGVLMLPGMLAPLAKLLPQSPLLICAPLARRAGLGSQISWTMTAMACPQLQPGRLCHWSGRCNDPMPARRVIVNMKPDGEEFFSADSDIVCARRVIVQLPGVMPIGAAQCGTCGPHPTSSLSMVLASWRALPGSQHS